MMPKAVAHKLHDLFSLDTSPRIFFAVCDEKEVMTMDGPGLMLEGTSNQDEWQNPIFTKFVEFVMRVCVDKSSNSLTGCASSSKTKSDWLYIMKYDSKYYTVALKRAGDDQAIIKRHEYRANSIPRNLGSLTRMTLIEGLPAFLKSLAD